MISDPREGDAGWVLWLTDPGARSHRPTVTINISGNAASAGALNPAHAPDLTDAQWALVLPLLPPGRVRQTPRGRARADRALFAIIALVVVREQPWSAGAVYGVHGSTLQRRWAQWREAGVFARMACSADGRTATKQWALLVARMSDERAARGGYPSTALARRAGPSAEDHRWAWTLQNAFPNSP